LSFLALCKRNAVEPFAWFRDVLTRIATHPIQVKLQRFCKIEKAMIFP